MDHSIFRVKKRMLHGMNIGCSAPKSIPFGNLRQRYDVSNHFRFHRLLEKSARMGKISSLPASIFTVKISLDSGL